MSVTDFDEAEWNQERIELEEKVISSVFALANFMGCNSFTLPSTLMDVKVLVTSRQVNEAIS